MGKQTFKNNGCYFFKYCLNELSKATYCCVCMDPSFYLDKLKKKDLSCEILEAGKVIYAERLKEIALQKSKRPKQAETQVEQTIEKRKTVNAAEFYIRIFNDFEVDPLTDKEIAARAFAFTGVKPTNRNISSYRCNYNKGKIKGQTEPPTKKVERKRK